MMAKVVQCDRCKGITKNENNNLIALFGGYSSYKNYDLCPDCAEKLINFIELVENE